MRRFSVSPARRRQNSEFIDIIQFTSAISRYDALVALFLLVFFMDCVLLVNVIVRFIYYFCKLVIIALVAGNIRLDVGGIQKCAGREWP